MTDVVTAQEILDKAKKDSNLPSIEVEKSVALEYDLRRLFAFDPTEVTEIDEENLLKNARDNVQLLLKELYDLPFKATEERGYCVRLPDSTENIPREKPLPKEKPMTKWEKFRRERGIKKRKRSKMEFDEDTKTWKRRWGAQKANDINHVPIIEYKEGDEKEDPWSRASREKKEKTAWNENKKNVNLHHAAGERLAGTIDLPSAIQASSKKKFLKKRKNGSRGDQNQPKKKKAKKAADHVDVALRIAQNSTVSMGKFDKKLQYEPDIKRRNEKAPAGGKMNFKSNKEKNMDILETLLGGKATKEKTAVNTDKLANMEQQKRNKQRQAEKKRQGGRGRGGKRGGGRGRGRGGKRGGRGRK